MTQSSSLAKLKEGIWVSWLMSETIMEGQQGIEHELQRQAFAESLKEHFILGKFVCISR